MYHLRKPRQAEERLSANQPGLANALAGGGEALGAATRAAEDNSPQDLRQEQLQLQEQLQELQELVSTFQEQEQLQELSAADPITTATATHVAEPGGGFIQPGVYRSIMRGIDYEIYVCTRNTHIRKDFLFDRDKLQWCYEGTQD